MPCLECEQRQQHRLRHRRRQRVQRMRHKVKSNKKSKSFQYYFVYLTKRNRFDGCQEPIENASHKNRTHKAKKRKTKKQEKSVDVFLSFFVRFVLLSVCDSEATALTASVGTHKESERSSIAQQQENEK